MFFRVGASECAIIVLLLVIIIGGILLSVRLRRP